jgi:hypothetical protein
VGPRAGTDAETRKFPATPRNRTLPPPIIQSVAQRYTTGSLRTEATLLFLFINSLGPGHMSFKFGSTPFTMFYTLAHTRISESSHSSL